MLLGLSTQRVPEHQSFGLWSCTMLWASHFLALSPFPVAAYTPERSGEAPFFAVRDGASASIQRPRSTLGPVQSLERPGSFNPNASIPQTWRCPKKQTNSVLWQLTQAAYWLADAGGVAEKTNDND